MNESKRTVIDTFRYILMLYAIMNHLTITLYEIGFERRLYIFIKTARKY